LTFEGLANFSSHQAIANIGWKYYLVFAVLNLSWTPFIWYFYVETAGLSLEEIDLMFKIKYNGAKGMSYKEASVLAREESDRQRHEDVSEKTQEVLRVGEVV
jgi:hypothetical protein